MTTWNKQQTEATRNENQQLWEQLNFKKSTEETTNSIEAYFAEKYKKIFKEG